MCNSYVYLIFSFLACLRLCQDGNKENCTYMVKLKCVQMNRKDVQSCVWKTSYLFIYLFQDDISVLLVEKEELLHDIIGGNQPIFVCEKAVS